MTTREKDFNAIIERCRLALRIKFQDGSQYHAEPLLEAEVQSIRRLGFVQALIQIVEFGDYLHKQKTAFNVIGAGGSSLILYLLGISEVDPVRYDTYFQRLWCTSNGEPPTVSFVLLPDDGRALKDLPQSEYVTAHAMSALEAVPELIRRRLPKVSLRMTEKAVFDSIQSGDTSGVFQLETESIQTLLSQVRPPRIKWLATVTALEQVSHSHPEITSEFVSTLEDRSKNPTTNKKSRKRLPILFQEVVMSQLQRRFQIPWNETYRYVQTAAKQRADDIEHIWGELGLRIESFEPDGRELLKHLAKSSQWAVCRAHHVANTITSYRAAYYRILHRRVFEEVLQEVRQWGLIQ